MEEPVAQAEKRWTMMFGYGTRAFGDLYLTGLRYLILVRVRVLWAPGTGFRGGFRAYAFYTSMHPLLSLKWRAKATRDSINVTDI